MFPYQYKRCQDNLMCHHKDIEKKSSDIFLSYQLIISLNHKLMAEIPNVATGLFRNGLRIHRS